MYDSGTSPAHGHLKIPTVKFKKFVLTPLKIRKVEERQ